MPGLPGFDFQNRFGREPHLRVPASRELAAETSTTARLAEEDYSGLCAEKWSFEVNRWPLVGHGQNWWECSTGYEIHSYALPDQSQSPSPMILLLVATDPGRWPPRRTGALRPRGGAISRAARGGGRSGEG